MPDFDEDRMQPSELRFDLRNPRMPDETFPDEPSTLEYLVENASLDELVDSITSSGWMDYEPMIVLRHDKILNLHNVVIEGNRRLAVLRLLSDPATAKTLRVDIPKEIHASAIPATVRVWLVDDRAEARDFIGFKHINGAFKWDSFAKAKYAAEWLDEEPDVDAVSRRLGDTHNTVVRLVNGYRVLRQSERQGFERERIPGRFSFSHLYTAMTRPTIRDFIGLQESGALLPENPIPDEKASDLNQLMVWLYGQDDTPPAIRSQNPDLKRLASVLQSPAATAMLVARPNLTAAYETVEDKPARFASELSALLDQSKTVASLIGNYDGDIELLEIAASTLKTVRSIHTSMSEESKDANQSR